MATAQPTRGSEQVSQAPKGSPAIAVSTTASEGNESDQPKMVDASTQTQETKAREDEIETSFRVDKPPHSHLPPSVSKYQYYYGDKTPSNRGEREKRQDKRKEVRPPGRQERVDSAEIRRKAIEAYITAVSDEEGEDQPEWLPNNVGENITNCGPRAPTRDAARGYESSETGDSDEDESSDSDDDDPLYLKTLRNIQVTHLALAGIHQSDELCLNQKRKWRRIKQYWLGMECYHSSTTIC